MIIEEFNKTFCAVLLLFMFVGSFIIGLGFSMTDDTSGQQEEAVAAGAGFDDSVTLTLDAAQSGEPYDPVEHAKEQLELERLAAEKGCIVIIPEKDGTENPRTTDASEETGNKTSEKPHIRRRYYQLSLSNEQQDKVFALSEEYDVPAELVFGIIQADALTGTVEAQGHSIMSPNSESAAWYMQQYGISDMTDFEQNVTCGIIMLSEYYHRYPNVHKIAMCYKSGEVKATELWSSGVIETEYSKQVALNINTLTLRE